MHLLHTYEFVLYICATLITHLAKMCDIELSRLIKQKRFSKSAGWVIVLLTILSVISMCILLRLPLRIDRLKKKVLIILIVIRRRTEAIGNSHIS